MSQQYSAAKMADSTLGSFRMSGISKSREGIISLNTHEGTFRYCGLFWSLEHGKDISKLEWVQQRAIMMVHLPFEERLRDQAWLTSEKIALEGPDICPSLLMLEWWSRGNQAVHSDAEL